MTSPARPVPATTTRRVVQRVYAGARGHRLGGYDDNRPLGAGDEGRTPPCPSGCTSCVTRSRRTQWRGPAGRHRHVAYLAQTGALVSDENPDGIRRSSWPTNCPAAAHRRARRTRPAEPGDTDRPANPRTPDVRLLHSEQPMARRYPTRAATTCGAPGAGSRAHHGRTRHPGLLRRQAQGGGEAGRR